MALDRKTANAGTDQIAASGQSGTARIASHAGTDLRAPSDPTRETANPARMGSRVARVKTAGNAAAGGGAVAGEAVAETKAVSAGMGAIQVAEVLPPNNK